MPGSCRGKAIGQYVRGRQDTGTVPSSSLRSFASLGDARTVPMSRPLAISPGTVPGLIFLDIWNKSEDSPRTYSAGKGWSGLVMCFRMRTASVMFMELSVLTSAAAMFIMVSELVMYFRTRTASVIFMAKSSLVSP